MLTNLAVHRIYSIFLQKRDNVAVNTGIRTRQMLIRKADHLVFTDIMAPI